MTPKQQGKAQAQRNVERMVAAALEGCGYEDGRAGVCEGGVDLRPVESDNVPYQTNWAEIERGMRCIPTAIFSGDLIPPIHTWWGTPKKERWFTRIWQRIQPLEGGTWHGRWYHRFWQLRTRRRCYWFDRLKNRDDPYRNRG